MYIYVCIFLVFLCISLCIQVSLYFCAYHLCAGGVYTRFLVCLYVDHLNEHYLECFYRDVLYMCVYYEVVCMLVLSICNCVLFCSWTLYGGLCTCVLVFMCTQIVSILVWFAYCQYLYASHCDFVWKLLLYMYICVCLCAGSLLLT